MLHIAICDDMPEESNVLKALLEEYEKEHQESFSIHVFHSGFSFIEEINRKKNFHLCFLDIYMPSFSGLDTAKELRTIDKDMSLIFCTSTTQFALDGYGVQASNYLLKPVTKEKLYPALDQVLRKIKQEKDNVFWFQTPTGLQSIAHSQIFYGEPQGNFSRLILGDQTSISCRLTFSELCQHLLKFPNFALIRRSTLLNYEVVVGMEGDDFLLENHQRIPIPRRKKKEITKGFLDYSMGQE